MTETRLDEGQDPAETAEVPLGMAGLRLDAVAARLFSDYSRSRLKTWIEEGRLRVNGAPAQRGRQPVAAGDVLDLDPVAEPDHRVVPQDLPIRVLHLDRHLAILDKPPGLTVHPGAGQKDGTLQNALLFHFPQTATVPRAGIVHRLDKDTSGALVVALTLTAHARLVAMLSRREISREYDAVISGTPVSGGTLDGAIGRHPRDRLKMAVVDGGRDAVTHFRIQERFSHHTHLRVKLETGRTHQIRVHLAHARYPIVGDGIYGGSSVRGVGSSAALRAALSGFPRQALHARELAFEHPVTHAEVRVDAGLPDDLQALLAALRAG